MGTNTMKIHYLQTEFVRKLMANTGDDEKNTIFIKETLQQYFNYDLVLLPFLFDVKDHEHTIVKNALGEEVYGCGCSDQEKGVVLVSIKVFDNQVDLFDKEFRENDSKSH
jgi:hypothetical protein